MRDYALLVRDRGSERLPDIQLVPYGFSWGAFLFQMLWALYRGAWLTAIVLLVAGLAAPALAEAAGLAPPAVAVVNLATALCLAFVAQDIRRWELIRRRYRLVDIVAARSLAEAEESAIRGAVDRLWHHQGEATEISSTGGLQASAGQVM